MKILSILILSLLLTACSTTPKNWSSIHQLDEAANFLMLVSDEEKGLESTCGLKPQDALNLLQPLHAMIDEESKKFTDAVDENQMMNCEKDCRCGLYSDLTSNSSKDDLMKAAKATSKAKLVACANKSAKWLCHGPLLKKLQSEIEPVSNAL